MLAFIFLLMIKGCMLPVDNDYIEFPSGRGVQNFEAMEGQLSRDQPPSMAMENNVRRPEEEGKNEIAHLMRGETFNFIHNLPKGLHHIIKYLVKCGWSRYTEESIIDYSGNLKGLGKIRVNNGEIIKELSKLLKTGMKKSKNLDDQLDTILKMMRDKMPSTLNVMSKWCSCLIPGNPLWKMKILEEKVELIRLELAYVAGYNFADIFCNHLLVQIKDGINLEYIGIDLEIIHNLIAQLHSLDHDFRIDVPSQDLRKYYLYIFMRMLNSFRNLESENLVSKIKEFCIVEGGPSICREKLCDIRDGSLRKELQIHYLQMDQALIKFCKINSGYLLPGDIKQSLDFVRRPAPPPPDLSQIETEVSLD